MALYESVFIARQDASNTQVETLAEEFTNVVAGLGGRVTKKEFWGLRNLTFRIKKNRKGHYVLLNIDAPSAAVQEMERLMRFNEDVLRYMSVRVEALEDGQSAMLLQRGERSERGERGDRGDRGDRGPRGPRGPRFGDRGGDRGDRGGERAPRRDDRGE